MYLRKIIGKLSCLIGKAESFCFHLAVQSCKCSGLQYLQALIINFKNWEILCINCLI